MLSSEQPDPIGSGDANSQIGRLLGHYTILRKLGEGAAASVYEAEDARIGRKVALKVLNRPEGQDRERNEREIERFKREARTIARLSHPNIVTIYDIGEQENDYYIVMECLAGTTLRERLDRGPIGVEEAVAIIAQIASALNAIHSNDIVHRDIKPSNAMLLPNDDPARRDWVKLLDFGIARLGDDSTLTHAGTLIGSPSYMSPEQVRGEPATKLSDVWALGILLYEMLSGVPPFRGPMITSVLYQIDHGDPEPLTGDLAAAMPVIQTALAKNPLQRYSSAGALSVALNEAVSTSSFAVQGKAPRHEPAQPSSEIPTVESKTLERRPARDSTHDADTAPKRSAIPLLAGVGGAVVVGLAILAAITFHSQHPVAVATASPVSNESPRSEPTKREVPATPQATASAIQPVASPMTPQTSAPAVVSKPNPTPTASESRMKLSRKESPPPLRPANVIQPKQPQPAAKPSPHPTASATPKPTPTVAPSPQTPAVAPTPGPIEKRPEPRRGVPPPADPGGASATVSDKVSSAHDLLGTWTGRIHNRPAKVSIKQSDGNGFSGEATITTDTGSAHFAIAGDVQRDGDKLRIAFQSVRLLADSKLQDVDFGQQSGHVIDGGNMAGLGKDTKFMYTWSLSR